MNIQKKSLKNIPKCLKSHKVAFCLHSLYKHFFAFIFQYLSWSHQQLLTIASLRMQFVKFYNHVMSNKSTTENGWRYASNISVANIFKFLMCFKTKNSCSNSSLKDDLSYPYNRQNHLLFKRLFRYL